MSRGRKTDSENLPATKGNVFQQIGLLQPKELTVFQEVMKNCISFFEKSFEAKIITEIELQFLLGMCALGSAQNAKIADRIKVLTEIGKTQGMYVFRLREAVDMHLRAENMPVAQLQYELMQDLGMAEAIEFKSFDSFQRARFNKMKENIASGADDAEDAEFTPISELSPHGPERRGGESRAGEKTESESSGDPPPDEVRPPVL